LTAAGHFIVLPSLVTALLRMQLGFGEGPFPPIPIPVPCLTFPTVLAYFNLSLSSARFRHLLNTIVFDGRPCPLFSAFLLTIY
jgi:hypothetical protein